MNTQTKNLENCQVLVVDDHRNIRLSLKLALEGEGAIVSEAESKTRALQLLATPDGSIVDNCPFDIFLFDIRLGDGNGLDLLKFMFEAGFASRVIMISGEGTVNEAYKATNMGAFDYIEKPFTPERIIVTARRCVDFNKLQKRVNRSDEILGEHQSILEVNKLISRVGKTNSRILIHGETGTGKELVAKGIHRKSLRASKPLVKVNCAAIPHTLIESELFGHEKGAFTGAMKSRKGLFEQGHGGTLFLDEIGELSLDVQAKLLRVLETGEMTRLGSEKTIDVDVRVVAATHRDLSEMVKSGEFREDLYYRLNVVTIHVPALRQRGNDVVMLARHFLEVFSEEHSLGHRSFGDGAISQLLNHNWPGNIRELKNVIERTAILAEGEVIESISDLVSTNSGLELSNVDLENDPHMRGAFSFSCDSYTWEDFHNRVDKAYVTFILKEAKGNVSEAARILCLERAYLHRLMKKLGIQRDVSIL